MMTAAASIRTRITSLFGCKYPIVLPGMSWISDPALVAAVSNAGGLGILAVSWSFLECVELDNSSRVLCVLIF